MTTTWFGKGTEVRMSERITALVHCVLFVLPGIPLEAGVERYCIYSLLLSL